MEGIIKRQVVKYKNIVNTSGFLLKNKNLKLVLILKIHKRFIVFIQYKINNDFD